MKLSPKLRCLYFGFAIAVVFAVSGCGDSSDDSATKEPAVEAKAHAHGDGDELVWPLKEKVGETGYELWLGHHGVHFHAGDKIEPAAILLKDGKPVETAKIVFLAGSSDSQAFSGIRTPMIFEPVTPDEPAHYAGIDLEIVADSELAISFEIEVESDKDFKKLTRDIKVKVGH